MLLFRSEGHVVRWCRAWGMDLGAAFSLYTAWKLAEGWYADRRDPEWRRPSLDEAEALLGGLGFTGPFWALR